MLLMANEPFDLQGPPQLDPQAPTLEPVEAGLKRLEGVRYDGEMIEHNSRVRRVTRVARGGGTFVQTGTGVRFVRILGSQFEKRPIRVAGDRHVAPSSEFVRIRTVPTAPQPYSIQPQTFPRKRIIAEPRVDTIDLTSEQQDNDLVHEDEYRMVAGFAKRPVETATTHVPSNISQQPSIRTAPVRYIRPTGVPVNTVRRAPATIRPLNAVPRPIPTGASGNAFGARVMRQMIGRGGLVQRTVRRPPVNMARVGYAKLSDPLKRAPLVRRPAMRFEFERNEDEERAIAEAIAVEEEIMRQEEEANDKTKNSNSLSLFLPFDSDIRRVEEGLRQKELATRSELERRRLAPSNPLLSTYTSPFARDAATRHQQMIEQTQTFSKKPSNLAPSKDDSPDMRVAKQLLDCMISQVCKNEKPEKPVVGWQRPLPQPIRIRESNNNRYPLLRYNQQDMQLHERMDILKREVMKRRQKIEEIAERETGITPPWKKSRARTKPRPKKKPVDQTQIQQNRKENVTAAEVEIKMVEDPSQISLGGDSVVYSKIDPSEESAPPDLNDLLDEVHALAFDTDLQELTPEHLSILDMTGLLETEEILEEGKMNEPPTELCIPLPSPKKSNITTKVSKRRLSPDKLKRESISEKSEASATTAASSIPAQPPRGRGRPPKSGNSKKEGSSKLTLSMLDASKCKCICKEAFDPRKFYIPCTVCDRHFHGQCVGMGDKKSKRMKAFVCDNCKSGAADLYCVCKKPYDSSQFYVGCDGCEGWFHPACVGTTESKISKASSYYCPSCKDCKTVSSSSRSRR